MYEDLRLKVVQTILCCRYNLTKEFHILLLVLDSLASCLVYDILHSLHQFSETFIRFQTVKKVVSVLVIRFCATISGKNKLSKVAADSKSSSSFRSLP